LAQTNVRISTVIALKNTMTSDRSAGGYGVTVAALIRRARVWAVS